MTKGIIFLIVLAAVITACGALYIKSLDRPADMNAFFVERSGFYGYDKQRI